MDELEEAFNTPTREPTRQIVQSPTSSLRGHADQEALDNLIRQVGEPNAVVFRFFSKCVPYWLATEDQARDVMEDGNFQYWSSSRGWHLHEHAAQSRGLLRVFIRVSWSGSQPIDKGQFEADKIDAVAAYFLKMHGRRVFFWNPKWAAAGVKLIRKDGSKFIPAEPPKSKAVISENRAPTVCSPVLYSPAWREASAAVAEARSALQLLRRTIYGRPAQAVRLSRGERSFYRRDRDRDPGDWWKPGS
jgi:hypothetical protein